MERAQKLVVITREYDLIVWSCRHTSRFPWLELMNYTPFSRN